MRVQEYQTKEAAERAIQRTEKRSMKGLQHSIRMPQGENSSSSKLKAGLGGWKKRKEQEQEG